MTIMPTTMDELQFTLMTETQAKLMGGRPLGYATVDDQTEYPGPSEFRLIWRGSPDFPIEIWDSHTVLFHLSKRQDTISYTEHSGHNSEAMENPQIQSSKVELSEGQSDEEIMESCRPESKTNCHDHSLKVKDAKFDQLVQEYKSIEWWIVEQLK